MDKVYLLITLYCKYYIIRKGMILKNGFSHLDHLFQKSLHYIHHKEYRFKSHCIIYTTRSLVSKVIALNTPQGVS